MIEMVVDMAKNMYPGHEWSYETVQTAQGNIYHILCDGKRTRAGYSEQIAKQLSSLGGPDENSQIVTSVKMQLDEYFSKNGREKEKKKEIY